MNRFSDSIAYYGDSLHVTLGAYTKACYSTLTSFFMIMRNQANHHEHMLYEHARQWLMLIVRYCFADATVVFTGSHEKGTAISPLTDIDCLVVFVDQTYRSDDPAEFMRWFMNALSQRAPHTSMVLRAHAITVQYCAQMYIDLTPAIQTRYGGYMIPEVFPYTVARWVYSNPDHHIMRLRNENQRHRGILLDIIRQVKQWRNQHCPYIKSFHLESLIIESLRHKDVLSVVQGCQLFFARALRLSQMPCLRDSANPMRLVDDYLTLEQREDFLHQLTQAQTCIA